MLWKCCTQYASKVGKLSSGHRTANPKEKQCQRKFKLLHNTTALISHISKVMLKILQARLQQYANWELTDVQAGFRKGRGIRDQIANICWIIGKSKRIPEKHLLLHCAQVFHCVVHNKLCKILKETGIPDYLTCLLRNLYADQEATVRTLNGTTDWFKIGKG